MAKDASLRNRGSVAATGKGSSAKAAAKRDAVRAMAGNVSAACAEYNALGTLPLLEVQAFGGLRRVKQRLWGHFKGDGRILSLRSAVLRV